MPSTFEMEHLLDNLEHHRLAFHAAYLEQVNKQANENEVDFQVLAKAIEQSSIIYLGENHTKAGAIQTARALLKQYPDSVLVTEYFSEDRQDHLDFVNQLALEEVLCESDVSKLFKLHLQSVEEAHGELTRNQEELLIQAAIKNKVPIYASDIGTKKEIPVFNQIKEKGSSYNQEQRKYLYIAMLWQERTECMAAAVEKAYNEAQKKKVIVIGGSDHFYRGSEPSLPSVNELAAKSIEGKSQDLATKSLVIQVIAQEGLPTGAAAWKPYRKPNTDNITLANIKQVDMTHADYVLLFDPSESELSSKLFGEPSRNRGTLLDGSGKLNQAGEKTVTAQENSIRANVL